MDDDPSPPVTTDTEHPEEPSDAQRRTDSASCGKEKNKRGIVYLSYIPDGLNPRNVRVLLSRFGEIDRIYFEPAKMRNGVAIAFREGWIEFLKKRVAKEVAGALNGSVISCRKKASYNGSVWSIKYLHRVKWHHLSEQVNVEKVARDQRLRLEMGRVKKESEFFAQQSDHMKKRLKKGIAPDSDVLDKRKQFYDLKQNRGADEAGPSGIPVDGDLLHKIFS